MCVWVWGGGQRRSQRLGRRGARGGGADAAPAPAPRVRRRLWRDVGGGAIEQANLYQAPDKMAGGGCTRFAPYLRADATRPGGIRPDGYGLRSWTFDEASDLVSVRRRE